jgi:hypothetical protein
LELDGRSENVAAGFPLFGPVSNENIVAQVLDKNVDAVPGP